MRQYIFFLALSYVLPSNIVGQTSPQEGVPNTPYAVSALPNSDFIPLIGEEYFEKDEGEGFDIKIEKLHSELKAFHSEFKELLSKLKSSLPNSDFIPLIGEGYFEKDEGEGFDIKKETLPPSLTSSITYNEDESKSFMNELLRINKKMLQLELKISTKIKALYSYMQYPKASPLKLKLRKNIKALHLGLKSKTNTESLRLGLELQTMIEELLSSLEPYEISPSDSVRNKYWQCNNIGYIDDSGFIVGLSTDGIRLINLGPIQIDQKTYPIPIYY
ncbi:MAG: hypothetical protein HEEMFOPI_00055 [Holosporales bacterium]